MTLTAPDFTPGRPRHEQLSDWLRDRIRSGHYVTHDQLPSEHELGQLAGVSRITVRRALATLENGGWIYRRQGLGSFVAPSKLPQGLVRLTDFAQDMARAGIQATSRVLHHAHEPASRPIATLLHVAEGTPVARLDRLRLGDGEPIAFDRTWLPLFYAQLLNNHDMTRETIYRVLERDHGIPIMRGLYRIEAVLAHGPEHEPLGVPTGAPLLLVERKSLTTGDQVVYFQRRYYRADRVAFDLELARESYLPHEEEQIVAGMPLHEFALRFKALSHTPHKRL